MVRHSMMPFCKTNSSGMSPFGRHSNACLRDLIGGSRLEPLWEAKLHLILDDEMLVANCVRDVSDIGPLVLDDHFEDSRPFVVGRDWRSCLKTEHTLT